MRLHTCKFAGPILASLFAAIPFLYLTASRANAAGLVFEAPTFSAAQGSSGSFDLLITNTSASSIHLAAESVEMSITGNGVQFTTTDTSTTTPYVFPDSFVVDNGFTLDATGIPYPKTDFITSDLSNIPASFVSIDPGDTFGLVHVSYSITSDATPGADPLTFESLDVGTSTSDENGNAVPFTTIDGVLTVTAVPEPASLSLVALFIPLTLRRSRRAQA